LSTFFFSPHFNITILAFYFIFDITGAVKKLYFYLFIVNMGLHDKKNEQKRERERERIQDGFDFEYRSSFSTFSHIWQESVIFRFGEEMTTWKIPKEGSRNFFHTT